jgi:hypothetical protein
MKDSFGATMSAPSEDDCPVGADEALARLMAAAKQTSSRSARGSTS